MSIVKAKPGRHAKTWLLTYPKCSLSKDWLLKEFREHDIEYFKGAHIKYMIICEEKHQSGDSHLHAFIMLDKEIKIGKKDMNRFDMWDYLNSETKLEWHPNIEYCNSPKDAIRYVKKDGNFCTHGICPYQELLSQKEKNELLQKEQLSQLVEEGTISLYKVPTLYRAREILRLERERGKKAEKPTVHWFYGKTGTGKTRTAYEDACRIYGYDNLWMSKNDDKWFDGYQGQPAVILDDIRPSTHKFSFLLKLLDRYPIEVPIKGGFARWCPKEIWVTAPSTPRELYRNYVTQEPYEGIEQLERRIDQLLEFTGYGGGEAGKKTKESVHSQDPFDDQEELERLMTSWGE